VVAVRPRFWRLVERRAARTDARSWEIWRSSRPRFLVVSHPPPPLLLLLLLLGLLVVVVVVVVVRGVVWDLPAAKRNRGLLLLRVPRLVLFIVFYLSLSLFLSSAAVVVVVMVVVVVVVVLVSLLSRVFLL